jgi:hypothetical protein
MAFSISLWRSSSRRFLYRYSRVLTRRPKLSYCGGGDGDLLSLEKEAVARNGSDIPVAICWDNIVNLKLLTDFLNTQMQSISLKLLAGHVGHDSSWKSHQASCLVLSCIAPAISLLAASGSIAGRFIYGCKISI